MWVNTYKLLYSFSKFYIFIIFILIMKGNLIGEVINFFERPMVVAIRLGGELKLGDTIRIVGGDVDFTEVVDSMQVDGKNIEKAGPGEGVGIKVSEKARKGYKVYKVE